MKTKRLSSMLIGRVWVMLGILLVYRIGQMVRLPLVKEINPGNQASFSFLKQFSMYLGGNYEALSLFSLGLSPWMTTMILWQLITSSRSFDSKKLPKRMAERLKYLLALVIAGVQAYSTVALIDQNDLWQTVLGSKVMNQVITCLFLVAGNFFVVWLVNMNTQFGLGGMGILIAMPMVRRLLQTLLVEWTVLEGASMQQIYWSILAYCFLLIPLTIILDRSEVRYYLKRPLIHNYYNQENYMPMKFNASGSMSIMFANSLFVFCQSFVNVLYQDGKGIQALSWLHAQMELSKGLGVVIYLCIFAILNFGFVFMIFNPQQIADNLRDNNEYLINIPYGSKTERYIRKEMQRLTFIGTMVMVVMLGVPLIWSLNQPELLRLTMMPATLIIFTSLQVSFVQELRLFNIGQAYQPIFPSQLD